MSTLGFKQRLDRKLANAPSDVMTFIEACAMGNIDRVHHLVTSGVNVNEVGDNKVTGLMIAAMSEQLEVLKYLLDLDYIDVNRTGMLHNTALMYAVIQGNPYSVKMLIESGSDVQHLNSSGKSCMGLAAGHLTVRQFVEVCILLISAGCVVNDKDWKVLKNDREKKIIVMMELLRTQNSRMSLRYQSRRAVLEWIHQNYQTLNPGKVINNLEIPKPLIHFLKLPI